MKSETFQLQSPIGNLLITIADNEVMEVDLGLDSKKLSRTQFKKPEESTSSYAAIVKGQLESYFERTGSEFQLKVKMTGTAFQQSVWRVIKSIQYGSTLTYSDIAKELNSSPRAVGNACRANPIPIIVPCHRVVSKSGLGGFAGQLAGENINAKNWLLRHEQALESECKEVS